jgi:predicted dehydrogenase
MGNLATHIRERKDESSALHEVTTDDEANLLLRFDDGELTEGTTGNASMSLVEPGQPEHRLELFGSKGALRIEERGELWQSRTGEEEWRRVETDSGELAPEMRDGGWARGFTAFSKRLVEALREGRTTVEGAATFADGHRTQLVLDAARQANKSGCWVKIE